MTVLDASKSKPLEGGASFSFKHRLYRFVWNKVWFLLAAWTPPPFNMWRIFLLNTFGAKIDKTANVYGSARVWYPPNLILGARACLGPRVNCYNMAPIKIESGAIVSHGTQLCSGSHDIEDPNFQLLVKSINIGKKVWIASECFIGPGVNIGDAAILGARTVLFRNVEPHTVYVGNPAKYIKMRGLYQKNNPVN